MPFSMFFMNIIIASTTKSNLNAVWALKNDEFSIKVWVVDYFQQNNTTFFSAKII